ncbi:MAG: DUF3783 domain-containing protein [bacterium]|nr:DUF3783 domain-containing protein [bacterium]
MNTPEFTPLDASDAAGTAEIPVILISGYSEAEVSRFVDIVRNSNLRVPAMAMVPDGVLDWKVGEYLSTIRTEHATFQTS